MLDKKPDDAEVPSKYKRPFFVDFFLTFLLYCITIYIIFAFLLWDIAFIRTVDPLMIRFSVLVILFFSMRSALEG